ncbi:hypothetical protein M3627_01130 [Psychrobacillus sp. MER TA 171]|nr:hypothetical protein [Psychrobacillus sp. MER TA 171]
MTPRGKAMKLDKKSSLIWELFRIKKIIVRLGELCLTQGHTQLPPQPT